MSKRDRARPPRWTIPLLMLLAALLASPSTAWASEGGGLGAALSAAWTLPFVGMLLSIAILPMVVHHWWENNWNQLLVSAIWSLPVLGYFGYLVVSGDPFGPDAAHGLLHAVEEYVSFIALLASLFVISGGILLRGDLEGKPIVNTAFLAVGALIANVVGTTGASMLLIRPLLRTNSEREYVKHIPIFFIFIVSNIGGALTPIGDPPLFIGYLRGVPFFWTLENLWHIWIFPVGLLLALFFALDTWFYRKEDISHRARDRAEVAPLRVYGLWNLFLLAGVVAAVLLLSPPNHAPTNGFETLKSWYAREIAMLILAVISLRFTPDRIHKDNGFTYGPILEVSALFAGIFLTMIPATMLLEAHGAEMGIRHPWQFFWATGVLSSFLDNTPTYATFAALACGDVEACVTADQLHPLTTGVGHPFLVAISVGAVFMGANTYIGNAPNFMVRAIAEENGYKMPSFFGYMGWSGLVLIPTFILVTFIYFA